MLNIEQVMKAQRLLKNILKSFDDIMIHDNRELWMYNKNYENYSNVYKNYTLHINDKLPTLLVEIETLNEMVLDANISKELYMKMTKNGNRTLECDYQNDIERERYLLNNLMSMSRKRKINSNSGGDDGNKDGHTGGEYIYRNVPTKYAPKTVPEKSSNENGDYGICD